MSEKEIGAGEVVEVVAWRIHYPLGAGSKVYEQKQDWAYQQYGEVTFEVEDLMTVTQHARIMAAKDAEIARLSEDHEEAMRKWGETSRVAACERRAHQSSPAGRGVVLPNVDDLSNFIRYTDGNHKMGAGALAERICDWLADSSAHLNPAPAEQQSAAVGVPVGWLIELGFDVLDKPFRFVDSKSHTPTIKVILPACEVDDLSAWDFRDSASRRISAMLSAAPAPAPADHSAEAGGVGQQTEQRCSCSSRGIDRGERCDACAQEYFAQQAEQKPVAFSAESADPGIYAIRYRDNWDGEGDTYYCIAEKEKGGQWVLSNNGAELLKYTGDEILRAWRLDVPPQPAPAQDVAGLVGALRGARKIVEGAALYSPSDRNKEAATVELQRIDAALSANEQNGVKP